MPLPPAGTDRRAGLSRWMTIRDSCLLCRVTPSWIKAPPSAARRRTGGAAPSLWAAFGRPRSRRPAGHRAQRRPGRSGSTVRPVARPSLRAQSVTSTSRWRSAKSPKCLTLALASGRAVDQAVEADAAADLADERRAVGIDGHRAPPCASSTMTAAGRLVPRQLPALQIVRLGRGRPPRRIRPANSTAAE